MLLSAAVGGGLLWLLLGAREIRLSTVPTMPRPAVVSAAGAVPLSFLTITRPPHVSGGELRGLHNFVVASLMEALEAHEKGEGSLRVAEQLEMRLLAIRRKLGVLSEQAYHQQMALLFGRELQRVETLAAMDPPRASSRAVQRAQCFHARERHFAGAEGTPYAALREQVLGELAERLRFLPAARKEQRESLQDELDALRQFLRAP